MSSHERHGPSLQALRGRLLWFTADPQEAGARAHRYIEDGAIILADGKVREAGEASALLATRFHPARPSRITGRTS